MLPKNGEERGQEERGQAPFFREVKSGDRKSGDRHLFSEIKGVFSSVCKKGASPLSVR
jgi:hypothetical protein